MLELKKKLKSIYLREMFNPRFLGFFINPFFITRRGLYKSIEKNRHYLKGKLLDFGCGSKPYQGLIRAEKYIGLDIKKSGHDHKYDQVDIFYNGKSIPFKKNYFNSVLCTEVFEHVFNLNEILNEIYRVLKPDGYLVTTMPFICGEHEIPDDCNRYTTLGIRHLVKSETRFQIVKIYKSGNSVETTFQMWINYLFKSILPENLFIRRIIYAIFFSHLTAVAYILSAVLPRADDIYLNNIIILKK